MKRRKISRILDEHSVALIDERLAHKVYRLLSAGYDEHVIYIDTVDAVSLYVIASRLPKWHISFRTAVLKNVGSLFPVHYIRSYFFDYFGRKKFFGRETSRKRNKIRLL